jgi:hypothetical protein
MGAIISALIASTDADGPKLGAVVDAVRVEVCSIIVLPTEFIVGALVVALVAVVPHLNVAANVAVPE